MNQITLQKFKNKIVIPVIFPVLLAILPLLRCWKGVDVTDTGYSLGSFIYQGGQMGEEWVKFATYLATALGSVLARLPGGHTMLFMNLYTGLLISITAVVSYCFLKTILPAWIAFLGEFLAISLCWCPTVILYNYLTYFLMTMMTILLYQGVVKNKKNLLFLAGILLGLNVMTRFPNITHCALILSVWFFGFLSAEEKQKENFQNTLFCIGGFLTGFLAVLCVIAVQYGIGGYGEMLKSLFGGNGGVEGHSLSDMLFSIADAYLVGCKWYFFLLLVVAGGFLLFGIFKERFVTAKKILYAAAVLTLFRFYYGRGMFNFRYYAYESMFQWLVIFLITSIILSVIKMTSSGTSKEMKLLASMVLLILLVTPLGSDNYLYPNINNLFFVAPVVLYWLVEFLLPKSRAAFPVKAMAFLVLLMIFVQSACFGATFVFRDGMNGEKRDTVITENAVLKGMHTNKANAEALEELTKYVEEHGFTGKKVLLYGNVPALSCFLDMPSALSTSWADLDSYPLAAMERDMEQMTELPLVIISSGFDAYLTEDGQAMERFQVDSEAFREDKKAALVQNFLIENQYEETMINEKFAVYEVEK